MTEAALAARLEARQAPDPAGAEAMASRGHAIESGKAHNSLARRLVATGLATVAMIGIGEAVKSNTAEASGSEPQVTTTHNTTIHVAGSKSSAESFSKLRIIANHRTVSKAEIRKAKKAGDCKTFSGKQAIKRGIQTQGYNGSGVQYAPENRRTTACDTDGDGKFDTRAECGNKLIIRKPQPQKAKQIKWVNSFNKAKANVRTKAVAKAVAVCKTANTYAYAFGRGEGFGKAGIRLRTLMKAKGANIKKLITSSRNQASMQAEAQAKADARVECSEQGGKVVPPEEVPPKDGTPGAGEGTPGQGGGGGAGGNSGNTNKGVICRDPADNANGDMNPHTQGQNMYGQEVDQFGYCVGKAEQLK